MRLAAYPGLLKDQGRFFTFGCKWDAWENDQQPGHFGLLWHRGLGWVSVARGRKNLYGSEPPASVEKIAAQVVSTAA